MYRNISGRCAMLAAALAIAMTVAPAVAGDSASTAFTFQGRLLESGEPVNEPVDLVFRLYDAATGGTQLKPTLSASDFSIEEGLFTIDLDFGNQFDGGELWLEIEVDETILAPRQPIMPTPYAIRAESVTNVPAGALGSEYDAPVTFSSNDNVFTGSFSGSGEALTGLSASNISSGTLGSAHLSGTYSNALNLTSPSNVFSGTMFGEFSGKLLEQATTPNQPVRADRVIATSGGLIGGGALTGNLNLSIAPGGVTATHLATNAVTTSKITSEAVTGAKIALGAVGSFHIDFDAVGPSQLQHNAASLIKVSAGRLVPILPGKIVTDNHLGIGGTFDGTNPPEHPLHVLASEAGDRAILAEHTATSGMNNEAIRGVTHSGVSSTAVMGRAMADTGLTYGVRGESWSSEGHGVFGQALHSNGVTVGVRGDTSSTNGRGVRGWAHAGAGETFGGHFRSDSSSGTGVHAIANHFNGETRAVSGHVSSSNGYAAYFTGASGSSNYFQRRVGIGTADPENELSVVGNADVSGKIGIELLGTTPQRMLSLGHLGAGIDGSSDLRFHTMTGEAVRMQGITNYVGINTTSPNSRLHVNETSGAPAIRAQINGLTRFVAANNGGVTIGANVITPPTNGLYVVGNVGIGTSAPPFTLTVDGSAAKPGGGLWSSFSDARLKHSITRIEPGMLDRLLSLSGYTFEYHDDAIENRLALPGTQVGLIAQEVAEVFPDWVDEDEDGYLYVTERGLTVIIVEALRELREEKDAEIDDLRVAIERLHAQNESLRQHNTALADRIAHIEKLLHKHAH